MTKTEWTEDPEIHCPVCDRCIFLSASFEYRLGSEQECGCGATLECADVEETRRWRWKVKEAKP